MTNLKLTAHFNLAEFERSATATTLGIDNTVPSQFVPRLQQLCKECLEPLRAHIGQPLIISSGYRCPVLNLKVGGVSSSQHTMGEAADIYIPKTTYTEWSDNKAHTDMTIAREWFDWLEKNVNFDQLILECSSKPSGEPSSLELSRGAAELRRSQTANGKDYWIHISCKKNMKKNRHQVLHLTKKSK